MRDSHEWLLKIPPSESRGKKRTAPGYTQPLWCAPSRGHVIGVCYKFKSVRRPFQASVSATIRCSKCGHNEAVYRVRLARDKHQPLYLIVAQPEHRRR